MSPTSKALTRVYPIYIYIYLYLNNISISISIYLSQEQWNRMPLRDPTQPTIDGSHTIVPTVVSSDLKDLRETLLNKMSMTKPMRLRALEKLSLLGMYNQDGDITELGRFAADLGCEPENAVLLWYANEFQVMEDALSIFAILERGPSFTTKERRIKVPHPDGDMHSLVNVWLYFQWLHQRTNTLAKDEKERMWSKEHVSLRSYQIVDDFRKEIGDRCQKTGHLRVGIWSPRRFPLQNQAF